MDQMIEDFMKENQSEIEKCKGKLNERDKKVQQLCKRACDDS